ncbi:MAG: hypothetical protein ACTHMX_10140 [Thermomicrobiales bacterium]
MSWWWQRFQGESSRAPERSTLDEPPDDPQEIVLVAAARVLDAQFELFRQFDARGEAAVATGSTVLPVTFGLLALSSRAVPGMSAVLLGSALVAYIGLLFCSWRASRIRVFDFRPQMETLEANGAMASADALRRWVASEYVAATRYNRPHLDQKGIWVGRAVTALYLEGMLLAGAAGWTLL